MNPSLSLERISSEALSNVDANNSITIVDPTNHFVVEGTTANGQSYSLPNRPPSTIRIPGDLTDTKVTFRCQESKIGEHSINKDESLFKYVHWVTATNQLGLVYLYVYNFVTRQYHGVRITSWTADERQTNLQWLTQIQTDLLQYDPNVQVQKMSSCCVIL